MENSALGTDESGRILIILYIGPYPEGMVWWFDSTIDEVLSIRGGAPHHSLHTCVERMWSLYFRGFHYNPSVGFRGG